MRGLGDQLVAILEPRTKRLAPAAVEVATSIRDRMLENTSEGHSWPTTSATEYAPRYTRAYANRAKSGKLAPVNLRGRNLGIETASVAGSSNEAVVSFSVDSRILKMHHIGIAKGGRMRTIFPKRIEQIPAEIKDVAQSAALEVLRG